MLAALPFFFADYDKPRTSSPSTLEQNAKSHSVVGDYSYCFGDLYLVFVLAHGGNDRIGENGGCASKRSVRNGAGCRD